MVLNCFLVSWLSWCKVTDGFGWRDAHSLCQNLGKYLQKQAQESWGGQEGDRESSKNILMDKSDLLGFPELVPHWGGLVSMASLVGQVSGWNLRRGLVSAVKRDGKNQKSCE